MYRLTRSGGLLLILALLITLPGCQTIRELTTLRDVKFSLDRVTDVRLAGISMSNVRSYSDLNVLDVGRLAAAVARKEVPLAFNVQVEAENPAENSVQARLVQLDWTLLLENRETISGLFDTPVVLQPGQPETVAFGVNLDLYQFFQSNGRDLVELVLAIAGQGGAPKQISLRATPTVETALGPITYPRPITIVSRQVGQGS